MRLSKQLLQASWYEGLVPAHWWVELLLVPLVGRAIPRDMTRGLCVQEVFKQPVH